MKTVLSKLQLSHVAFAALFWCIGVFLSVGSSFGKYEQFHASLRETRREAVLSHIKQILQTQTDMGASLPRLRGATAVLSRFALADGDISDIFVFAVPSGKILFSSKASQAGEKVSAERVKRCAAADSFIRSETAIGKAIALPVLDSSNAVAGCVALEYASNAATVVRQKMTTQSVRAVACLSLSGILLLSLLFVLARLCVMPDLRRARLKTAGACVAVLCAAVLTIGGFRGVERDFQESVKPEIAAKSKTVAKILRDGLEKALQAGVPLRSFVQADAFLDTMRRAHREIAFILITDESGRVLYESGSPAEAFETDGKTGRVRLRDGYLNTAEALRAQKTTAGWLQIGVKTKAGAL